MPSIKPEYPLDSVVLAVMREVHTLITEMRLSYFVCGAVARDVLLRHVHGIETGRVTADVDFAVALERWEQFYEIKDRLIKTERFEAAGRIAQRLYYRGGSGGEDYPLDIIPFGKVENPPNSIKWPRDGNEVIGGVPEEDDAQHRHAIFAGRELGVCAQLVSRLPEAIFNLFDILEFVTDHVQKR